MKKNNNNRYLLHLIKHPIITDKTSKNLEDNIYWFAVEKKSDKHDLKKAIEYIFDVKIKKINTLNQPKKKKHVGKFHGYVSQYKKAVVKLHDKYTINLFNTN